MFTAQSRGAYLTPLFALILTAIVPVQAVSAAQNDVIEEIIVTADFRDAGVSKLPASISVIRPNEEGSVVNHLEEILGRAPNVNFASGAARARFFQIRGIGERGQFSEPLNSSVGLVVDGVDLSGIGTAATLFDVEQVEVLRGPQGTLFGANALAGLINIVTPSPTADHAGYVRLDAGDYGAFGVGAVVSGPLSESVGYRVAVQKYRDDGFIDNDFLGRDDTNSRDETTFRSKFLWQGDGLDVQFIFGHTDIDNGYDAFSLDNNRTTLSDRPGRDEQQTDYASLSANWDLSESVLFQTTLSVADNDISYGYDEDWTFDGFDPIGYSSVDSYERDRDTLTLDARWLSKPGNGLFGSAWDWVAGVYLFRQDVALVRDYTFSAGLFESDFEVERVAAYGEVSRDLSDNWRLTVGGRYERHQSDYDDTNGVRFSPEDDLFGGRVLLEKNLDSGALVYAGITQGYKSGGFNQDGSLAADLREFDAETLWNVEVGYKAQLLDGRLRVRGALFRMQRDDIQISTSTERPIPGGNGAVEFIVFNGNAAEGFNQGVEVEVEYFATQALTLFANLGVLDTEYQDFVDNSGRDLDGRDQAHAPAYQFYAGGNYAFNDNLSLMIEFEGKDEYFFSASHSEESDAYQLVNASLVYTAENWQARLWGRNLTDEDYFVRGFFFGNDPRDSYTARAFTQLGEPRQVGLSFQYDF